MKLIMFSGEVESLVGIDFGKVVDLSHSLNK